MADDRKYWQDEQRLRAFESSFLRRYSPLPPPRSCPIGWQPNALAPVFYGVRDYSTSDGAPTPLRVFFPSLDGAVFSAPILEGCGRYPVILFAHGHCPGDGEHFKKWYQLPAQLARSGYVTVVPFLPLTSSGTHPQVNEADLSTMANVLQWIRSNWEHRDSVLPAPATGIVGHSFGGLLSARFASANGLVAYASLSGVHTDFPTQPFPIEGVSVPMLLVTGGENDLPTAAIGNQLWNALVRPRHRAVFTNGRHFDYLPSGQTPCDQTRGPCQLVAWAATDLVTMFFAKYLPPELTPNLPDHVPNSLIPPTLVLTPEQEFFAGLHLIGFSQLQGKPGCEVQLDFALPTDRVVPYVKYLPRAVADHDVRNADLVPQFTGPTGPGVSWVFTQSPLGGTVVSAGSTVKMTLRTGEIP